MATDPHFRPDPGASAFGDGRWRRRSVVPGSLAPGPGPGGLAFEAARRKRQGARGAPGQDSVRKGSPGEIASGSFGSGSGSPEAAAPPEQSLPGVRFRRTGIQPSPAMKPWPLVRVDDQSGHLEDSGCSVSNDDLADTQEASAAFSHSERGPASDASSVLSMLASSRAGPSKSLVPHIQFLRRFLELKRLAEHGGVRTDLGKLGRDSSAISDSFSRLLDGLVAAYSFPEVPFSDFMTRAVCAVITELLSDADVSRQILGKCLKKLEDSVERLIDVVLNSSHLNRFQVQESISHALVSIGQCNRLRRHTIFLLFREVSRFADELQHADEIQAGRDTRYENIFFLCRALEQLLEIGTEEENVAAPSGCDEEEKKMFLHKLDQAIFHLCDEFPLFCIYLWRLGTLLNVAHTQTGGRSWPAM
uniref:Uncharacterized protein n=1 Tax=Podarcis muralis TaxID=64176 RepID=A0A670J4Y6_PODMU